MNGGKTRLFVGSDITYKKAAGSLICGGRRLSKAKLDTKLFRVKLLLIPDCMSTQNPCCYSFIFYVAIATTFKVHNSNVMWLSVLTYRRRDKGRLVEGLRFYILLLGIQFLEVPLLLEICLWPIVL